MPYYTVILCKNGIHTTSYVHRLVAKAFIPNEKGFLEINHLDENPRNNRVDNLEWCSRLHNLAHNGGIKRRSVTRKESGTSCYSAKSVCQYSLDGYFIAKFFSSIHAARALGIPNSTNIRKCARGCTKQSHGYRWIYSDNPPERLMLTI